MGAQEKYQDLISHETGFFSAVCDMMQHSKVADGRRFLCTMNNIVDHFCERQQEGSINYQIIYVPTCPEWARELLVRFLIQRIQRLVRHDRLLAVFDDNIPHDLTPCLSLLSGYLSISQQIVRQNLPFSI